MTVHRKKLVHTAAKLSALALISVGLGAWDLGCSDCGSRTEFVTRGVGDSIDANKATQTIDPWPPYVKNRKLDLAGPRAGPGDGPLPDQQGADASPPQSG